MEGQSKFWYIVNYLFIVQRKVTSSSANSSSYCNPSGPEGSQWR